MSKILKKVVVLVLVVGLFAGVEATGHSIKCLIDPPGFGQS